MAIDAILRRHGGGPARRRFRGELAEASVDDEKILTLKPLTYMNDSGSALAAAARYYKIPPERVYVIHDEIDLVPGKIRVKRGGGHGGHNGLRDICAHFGTDFWRLRLGVGHPGDKRKVERYVLNDFAKAERPLFETLVEALADALPLLLAGDEGRFMNKVTLAVAPPKPRPERAKKSGSTDAASKDDRGI